MATPVLSRTSALFLLLSSASYVAAQGSPVQVNVPSTPSTDHVVNPNFLGISLELSALDIYFGNDSSSTPQPVLNYLTALNMANATGFPYRLRIGGNSMDSSTFVPSQTGQFLNFTDPNANFNDQPVTYGPVFFEILNKVSDSIGAEYLLGLSLRNPSDPNSPLLAGSAQSALGNSLDALLLGNEPDLYTSHGNRPNLKNYTVEDYVNDFSTASNLLKNTSAGDITARSNLAGPTICCSWDLATTLQQNWLSDFSNELKYITLVLFLLVSMYYVQHANAVQLAKWQLPGIQYALGSNPTPKPVLMDEFNSASCGGIPGTSDTFGAALWTADYSLQMASVGYAAAYIHTREPGVSYNLFSPPPANNTAGGWTTGAPYYGMLPVSYALRGNGSKIVDLDISSSTTNKNATSAGYAVYDANSSHVNTVVLFNFADTKAQTQGYNLGNVFPAGYSVTVKYLVAPAINEVFNIAWGGQTLNGVGDGKLVNATWQSNGVSAQDFVDKQVDCSNGCTINVPGPGLAVVSAVSPVVATSHRNNGASSGMRVGFLAPSAFVLVLACIML
ncbi:hypothetical protein EWM64_g8253 [Hericium alpestre]|uniref:Beta-glucuronidase C-terminal domain-containing protein n=1 Tax=Hericium alpestre TaxID=135208 RepID=A0A4Y9ZQM5_9AGAM|nr:hypothetical protein EWM64_g8253 [Hericium alpestre]